MIALNLIANTEEETDVKSYLEKNVSEALAEKINNGVRIVKDGKTLINKKTLALFWKYAGEEAQKLAEQGARVKAIKKETVFGWAVHYFEEDSIEGTLFNEDGTEFKPIVKPAVKPIVTKTEVKPATPPKPSLFDLVEPEPDIYNLEDF